MYINNLGHMTKMAAMPIYGKIPSGIFFSDFNETWREASMAILQCIYVMTLTMGCPCI